MHRKSREGIRKREETLAKGALNIQELATLMRRASGD